MSGAIRQTTPKFLRDAVGVRVEPGESGRVCGTFEIFGTGGDVGRFDALFDFRFDVNFFKRVGNIGV